jgi:hypothetical protein
VCSIPRNKLLLIVVTAHFYFKKDNQMPFTYDKEKLAQLKYQKERYLAARYSAYRAFMDQQEKVKSLRKYILKQPKRAIPKFEIELKIELRQLKIAEIEWEKQEAFVEKHCAPILNIEMEIDEWKRGNFK